MITKWVDWLHFCSQSTGKYLTLVASRRHGSKNEMGRCISNLVSRKFPYSHRMLKLEHHIDIRTGSVQKLCHEREMWEGSEIVIFNIGGNGGNAEAVNIWNKMSI